MGKRYIIELEEAPFIQHFKNGAWETIYRVKGFNSLVFDWNGLNMLTPYTEPDMEQVRKEAYEQGLSDAWEAARKIGYSLKSSIVAEIFGTPYSSQIFSGYSASEAIEKIRQYEQEKEMDGLRQNIQTIVDQCGYSLDEIAEALQKMKKS